MQYDVTAAMLKSLIEELPVACADETPRTSNAQVPASSLTASWPRSFNGQPQEVPFEIAKLQSALSVLSPDALRGQAKLYEPGDAGTSQNYWLVVIWGIASLGWTCGRDIAQDWSRRSTRYTEDGFTAAWNAYDPSRPNPITVASLFRLAIDNGWSSDAIDLNSVLPITANASRYRVLSPVDVQALRPQKWRVKNVLPETGLAALFGPSGSGKSFLALDLASAISRGTYWFGMRTYQAPVCYVMLEGEGGIRNRMAALESAQGQLPIDRFGVVTQQFHLTTPQDVTDLAAVIPHGAVVFIDTLNRAAPTTDENSSKEMGIILEGAKALQSSTGGLVIVVHHTGKDATKGMRGHSSLHAALDAAIEVERSVTGGRHWSIAKSKDGEDGKRVAFNLKVHVLGQDADGDDISSCSVEPDLSGIFVKPEPQGRNQRQALKAIKKALSGSQASTGMAGCPAGVLCMKVEDAVAAISSAISTTPRNKRRSESRRLIDALIEREYIGSGMSSDDDVWCWLL